MTGSTLYLVQPHGGADPFPLWRAVAEAFDPARLTQARHLAGLTKRQLATDLQAVTATAVGLWESGATSPRAELIGPLAEVLDVVPEFFAAGRYRSRITQDSAHFRSLRSTPAALRAKATAFTQQVDELAAALEALVRFPEVQLPGYVPGEVDPSPFAGQPVAAAQYLRRRWELGQGPVRHLVRTLERHGIVVTLVPFAGADTAKIDAFSTGAGPRPLIVCTPDRADDVYRHRFTAAHELGHLFLHGDAASANPQQEREADAFAAEFLTPAAAVVPALPTRLDLGALQTLSRDWGVSIESLAYRSHEVGRLSEASYRRAFQRIRQHRNLGLIVNEPVRGYPGEIPSLLSAAFTVATTSHGITLAALARRLRLTERRLGLLLDHTGNRRPPALEPDSTQ